MIKKFFLFSVVISQLATSCSSDKDESANDTNPQITELLKKPYSALTPDEQKVKLEDEANGMLTQMESAKSSTALDAFENLESIFSVNLPNIQFGNKTAKTVQEVLNVTDVYGIFTWNSETEEWVETASKSELKFLFPANDQATTNNASLTASSVASTVKIVMDNGQEMFLPSSVTATLKIGDNPVGKFDAKAVYANGKPEPTEASYKLTLNGFVLENNAKRTSPVSVNSSFSHEGKNIISFNVGSTADIDNLMQGNELSKYFGTANCLITLMDNFVLVADMNVEGFSNDDDALDKITRPSYNAPAEAFTAYEKTMSEGLATAFNKNVKMALVSKKDGTKLADVIKVSTKGDIYNGHQEYNDLLFLRFNDKTEVAMDAYFSSGFGTFETKFEDFLTSFLK
jgi:hypothetical protein